MADDPKPQEVPPKPPGPVPNPPWPTQPPPVPADEPVEEQPPTDSAIEQVRKIFGLEPYELDDTLQHAAGLLDVIKGEWGDAWSEHDQRVRAGLSLAIMNRQREQPKEDDGPEFA